MMNFRQYNNVTKIVIPNNVQLTTNNFQSMFQNMKNVINIQIPPSVINLYYTYSNCLNLVGPPSSGDDVINMGCAYNNCRNLTGSPACGPNVINMSRAYSNCSNLTGSPVCGENVTSMSFTYESCYNLTGSPVCGKNVTSMYNTYRNCRNLTGLPICEKNVENMYSTYCNCFNLTGSPVCGEKVINMSNTYFGCYNLTGSPVCGEKVTNMFCAYAGCRNLTGSPVCGNNVTTLYSAYSSCNNLTGSPVCGDNVTSMSVAYYDCSNLTGSPVCGNKVADMDRTYLNCHNLTGSPVCGENVTDMYGTYMRCYNLTGSPVCGEKVTNMQNTYSNCYNLTGFPVCGNQVKDMCYAYEGCSNLTGSPVCGENVTGMSSAYARCSNLTGSPVCGENVVYMSHAYANCSNLTGSPICGTNVLSIPGAYAGCERLAFNGYFYSNKIINAVNCFYGRNTSNYLNLYVPTNSTTLRTVLQSNSQSLVGANITWTDDTTTNGCYYNTQYNIYIYPVSNVRAIHSIHQNGGIHLEGIKDVRIKPNTTKVCTVPYLVSDTSVTPSINVTTSAEEIVSISDIVTNSSNFEFTLNAHGIEGTTTITAVMTQGELTQTRSFIVKVSSLVASYSVEAVDGAQYSFALNASDYYESNNKGFNNSYALCKVNIVGDGASHMYVDCINYAESNYDYGILSNLDKTLEKSYSADTTNVFKSFKGSQSASIQTVDYGVIPEGEHYIYIKFIKDSSQSTDNDTLQFKVRFE